MNLLEANLESLSNDELDFLAAEARGFPAVGYYGPTKSKGSHTDQHRYDTKAEALAQYVKYWLGEPGCVCGADMDEDDIHLCYWKENWGSLIAPRPTDADEGLEEMTFEQWFFEQYPNFIMQILKDSGGISVEISHDTHEPFDAYFDGDDEYRLRTMAVLEVLKQLEKAKANSCPESSLLAWGMHLLEEAEDDKEQTDG